MRNLFEIGVAVTKEEKLFVLNTILSDFAEDNIISKHTSNIITNAITSDDVIKFSYVVREDIGEIGLIEYKVIDFHFAVSDKDDNKDSVYFSLKVIDEIRKIFDDKSKWLIKISDFLEEINFL